MDNVRPADRGFKHIASTLLEKNCILVRPPTVLSDAKISKADVKLTKQIASLRIDIERIIRIREFYMLKPHPCINTRLIAVLNDAVLIAAALVNLQEPIILQ